MSLGIERGIESGIDNPIEEGLTPKQLRAVRKEMLRRRALQTIDTIYWTDDPSARNASTLSSITDKRQAIANLLLQHSFVQVRSIVPEGHSTDTRIIKNIAERLAVELQMEIGTLETTTSTDPMVHIVEIKGRMVTYFYENSSTLSLSSSEFRLRTTGKQNNWIKRPKALRDNAGQIIK